jgi:hypothetical protein
MSRTKPPAPPADVAPGLDPAERPQKDARASKRKPKPKAAAKDKGAPKVCSSCGQKWARFDADGLCSKCAKQDPDELPPLRSEDVPSDPDAAMPTPQEIKRQRIFEIAQLMASGEWRASMAKTLAKAWSSPTWTMSVKTVQHYSAEASRLLDYTTGQREKLVNIARLRLLQVLQENESDRVQAARTLLEHMGELRQNVVLKQPDPFEGWSEDEIKAYADTGERPARFGPKPARTAK